MDKAKVKAMERLIFLSRTNQNASMNLRENLRIGFKDTYAELDRLKVPMWKQNNISYLAINTNWDMTKIIKLTYYAKKPVDVNKLVKGGK